MRKRRIDGLHRGGRSRSAASKQRPRRARLAGPATSSNGVSPQTQLREPPVLSVHCCAGYATIYTVASGHKEATINARRAEMLYMAACRVLRDRAAAPSQSVWASSAGQIASPGQIDRARSEPMSRAARCTTARACGTRLMQGCSPRASWATRGLRGLAGGWAMGVSRLGLWGSADPSTPKK